MIFLTRQKAGVISEDPCWVFYHAGYLYTAPNWVRLLVVVLREWKHDRHLAG